ncbi:MAG: uncharacterized protein A8A55_2045 [Amphiamblys sp. WSBS2006]|nr:MAG: uncharacterized protein A8A55_2045 [Amphiamblys sp. WSBS2006]
MFLPQNQNATAWLIELEHMLHRAPNDEIKRGLVLSAENELVSIFNSIPPGSKTLFVRCFTTWLSNTAPQTVSRYFLYFLSEIRKTYAPQTGMDKLVRRLEIFSFKKIRTKGATSIHIQLAAQTVDKCPEETAVFAEEIYEACANILREADIENRIAAMELVEGLLRHRKSWEDGRGYGRVLGYLKKEEDPTVFSIAMEAVSHGVKWTNTGKLGAKKIVKQILWVVGKREDLFREAAEVVGLFCSVNQKGKSEPRELLWTTAREMACVRQALLIGFYRGVIQGKVDVSDLLKSGVERKGVFIEYVIDAVYEEKGSSGLVEIGNRLVEQEILQNTTTDLSRILFRVLYFLGESCVLIKDIGVLFSYIQLKSTADRKKYLPILRWCWVYEPRGLTKVIEQLNGQLREDEEGLDGDFREIFQAWPVSRHPARELEELLQTSLGLIKEKNSKRGWEVLSAIVLGGSLSTRQKEEI